MTNELVLIPQHFGCLIFDRRTSRYMPFDHEATTLFHRLSREPFDTVLASATHVDELEGFFDYFYDRGFFTHDLRFAGDILDIDPPDGHLTGPLAVHLEIVAACNLKCTHCFAGDLPRRETPLTIGELDKFFATLSRMGAFRLGLTGGEPLLRKDIFEIVDLATSHGLHPCLTTNGLLITEEIAREFGKRKLVWLNVSLEGATATTNDKVRGDGTFDRVIDKLKLLAEHARFTLAFTVMKTNSSEVRACAKLAREVGAHTAVFRPMYPVGVGARNMELMPTVDEYNDALIALSTPEADSELPLLSKERVGVRLSGSLPFREGMGVGSYDLRGIDPFSPLTRSESQSTVFTNGGCGAGNLVCSVSVSGDVNPCSFLGPDYIGGNVRDTPFEEIWHRSARFAEMRATLPDGFNGGCRARSLAYRGSVHAADPWLTSSTSPSKYYHPLTVLEVTA